MHDHQGDPEQPGLTRGELQAILDMHDVDDEALIDLEVWAQLDKPALNNLQERGGRIRVDLTEVTVEKVSRGPDEDPRTTVRLVGHAHR